MSTLSRHLYPRIVGVLTSVMLMLTLIAAAFPAALKTSAASTGYPVQLLRISTGDNSRNLNISGYSDKSALNTWTTNGEQNENWRFDLAGTNSTGSYFRIVNQGTGRLITPLDGSASAGTSAVIYGRDDSPAQQWYVIPVAQDKLGNDLYYKITNYSAPDLALTYNSSANTVTLSEYTGANSQKWLLNTAGLQGFAGYCKTPSGDIKASAVGGLFGKTVEVTTFDELKAACTSKDPMTIIVTKDIYGTSDKSKYEISTGYDNGQRYYCRDNYIYLQPNKTIIGSYGAHKLYNVYFRTYDKNYGPGYNVIIRNFDLTHDTELNTDNIWEFAYGWNFWIDHIDFRGHDKIETSSLGSDDWDKFLNFKGTSDYVTVSDCSFGHHEYGVLLGYPTDDEETYKTYNGQPCVTLSDNYYHDTVTRAPALMRYGYYHSFNNYVYNFSMGYTVHTASEIYAENCYYEKGGNVICDWNQITYPGAYAEDGSVFVSVSRTKQGEGTANNPSYSVPCKWRPSSNYTYKAMSGEDVKTYTMKNSGSKSSASAMTYAAFASAGVPAADYISVPSKPVVIEPIDGTLVRSLNVVENAFNAKWSIAKSSASGDLVYGDREVAYSFLPKLLTGAERIITSCDAKNVTGRQAQFTAGADMTVYIALDRRVEAVPGWMSGCTDTGLFTVNSSDVVYEIYSCAFHAGDTVTLSTNGQSAGCVNYTVFARKLTGDVNDDGTLNVADLVSLQKWLLAVPGTQLANWKAGDICPDDRLDAFDMVLMRRELINEQALLNEEMPDISARPQPVVTAYEPADFKFSGNVYLVGDSTVCEYDSSTSTSLDRYGWGMKLADKFKGVTVKNLALSGRSSRSFLTETNYQTLCSSIGKGDYLFIQFGHNDEKTDEAAYPGLGTYPGLDLSTLDSNGRNSSGQYSYEWILLNKYIKAAQNKGAVAVICTPITRRSSNGEPYYQAHTAYQQALIELGKANNVPVIDLTTLTAELYSDLYAQGGADATAALHCFTDSAHTTTDNTHLSSLGANHVSQIVADQIKSLGLTLGKSVK